MCMHTYIKVVQDYLNGTLLSTRSHACIFCSMRVLWQGKKCTAYPAIKPQIVNAGAEWLEPNPISKCFKDGNLVTGAAWPAHPEFISQFMYLLGTAVTF